MIAALLSSALLLAAAPMAAPAPPVKFGAHASAGADEAAIRVLLATYTDAVTRGDEAAFKALLLNDSIAFTGVGATITDTAAKPFNDADFKSFDQGIFRSGTKYRQAFYNVHILQDGPLAQVSLDFVTQLAATGRGGYGWKILQLVKVDGAWKIASEFYTGHPLPHTS